MSRRALTYLLRIVLSIAGALLLLVVFLRTSWGLNWTAKQVLSRLEIFQNATLQVDRLEGNIFSRLILNDVRLVNGNDTSLVVIPRAEVGYRLGPLLSRVVHLTDISINEPQFTMSQASDGYWDLPRLTPTDTTSSGWAVRIDRFDMAGGAATAKSFAGDRDSTYHIRDVNLQVNDFVAGEGVNLSLERLTASMWVPGRSQPVELSAKGALNGLALKLTELALSSSRSNLSGAGTIVFAGSDSLHGASDFNLSANPLSFDDVRLVAPWLAPEHEADILLHVEGSPGSLSGVLQFESDEGSTLEARGAFSTGNEGRRSYQLAVQLPALNTRLFAVEALPPGTIKGQLNLNLDGPEFDRLSGSIDGMLVNIPELADKKRDSTRFEVTFEEGVARTRLHALVDDALVIAEGTLTPFGDRPEYDLTASLAEFDVANYTSETQTSALNAVIRVRGQGTSLDDLDATASIRFEPSLYNRLSITAGTLEVSIDKNNLAFDAGIDASEGSIQAVGRSSLGQVFRIGEVTGQFAGFDLAAALGDTTRSAFTGSVQALDLAFQEQLIEGTVALDLSEASWGNISLESARLEGQLEGRQVGFETSGRFAGGRFEMDGLLAPFEEEIAYEITRGAFFELDVGPFLAPSNHRSDLNGQFTLAGTGFEPGVLHTRGSLDLSASQFNQQSIREAHADFSLEGDTLALDLRLDLPEGESRISGFATEITGNPHYRVTRGILGGLDVGKIAGIPDLNTRLNGTLEGEGRGFDINTLEASSTLNLRASSVNEASIENGFARVHVNSQQLSFASDISIDDGEFTMELEAQNLMETPEYRFQGMLRDVDVAGLTRSDTASSSVNLNFNGEGRGTELETMNLTGSVEGRPSSYRGVRVEDLRLAFSLEDGLLEIDTLQINSIPARIAGRGPIALFDNRGDRPSDFVFETRLLDLEPLAPLLGMGMLRLEEGTLNTRLYGRPGTLRFDTRASLVSLVYNEMHVGNVVTRFTGEFGQDRSLALAELDGNIEALSTGSGFVLERVNVIGSYQGDDVRFEVDGNLDARRNARISGRYFAGTDSQHVQLDAVDLNIGDDVWALDEPAMIDLGRQYRVSRFFLNSGDQQIAVDGVIDFEGEQNMLVTINNLETGAVTDLLGYPGLDGPFNGLFDIRGRADSLVVTGDADMHVISFGEEAGDLSISLEYGSSRLHLDVSMMHVNGHTMTLSGYLPVDLTLVASEESGEGISQRVASEGDVDLQFRADSMQVEWILPLIDQSLINSMEALITADVRLSGTASDPSLQGQGRLERGRLRSPLFGVAYTDISTRLALRDNVIELVDTHIGSNGGRLAGNGTIEFSSLTDVGFDIDIALDRFNAIDTREYRAVTSGNLKLSGSYNQPSLEGSVRLLSADMYLDEIASASSADLNVQLTNEDLLMLEREFGIRPGEADTTTFDLYEALTMDVDVQLDRDNWVRSRENPEMNVQLSGELNVTKSSYEDPVVFGSIEVNPERSYVNQFGKRFNITRGTVSFNGPASDPLLDFEAHYDVPSRRSQDNAVAVTLHIEGRVENLDLTLSSEPTMELTDIISYVVTGQPASEALQLSGSSQSGIAGAGTGFALNQGVGILTGAIETLFQDSGLELDVINIEPLENAKGATVTAGKYVTPRLFTAVSQPIGSDGDGSSRGGGTVITLEFELVDSLLLRLLGGESVMNINLLWHHAY